MQGWCLGSSRSSTAVLGSKRKASAGRGERALPNSGSSQSSLPGNTQSRQIMDFGILWGEAAWCQACARGNIQISVKLSQQGVSMSSVYMML